MTHANNIDDGAHSIFDLLKKQAMQACHEVGGNWHTMLGRTVRMVHHPIPGAHLTKISTWVYNESHDQWWRQSTIVLRPHDRYGVVWAGVGDIVVTKSYLRQFGYAHISGVVVTPTWDTTLYESPAGNRFPDIQA